MTGGGVLIDVPQLAYKTWLLQVYDSNVSRMLDAEKDLRASLKEYVYAPNRDHVK